MMNSTIQFSIKVLAAAIALHGIAGAADEKPAATRTRQGAGKARDPEAVFKRLDADSDGKVTAEEFKKARERLRARGARTRPGAPADAAKKPDAAANRGDRGARMFERLDANKDGALSLDEFRKFGERRAQDERGKGDPEKRKKPRERRAPAPAAPGDANKPAPEEKKPEQPK